MISRWKVDTIFPKDQICANEFKNHETEFGYRQTSLTKENRKKLID